MQVDVHSIPELQHKLNCDYERGEALDEAWQVFMLFDGMGVLIHRKLIDVSLVDDLISGPIKNTWEKMKPMIEGYRKQFNQTTILRVVRIPLQPNAEKRTTTNPKNNLTTQQPSFSHASRADSAQSHKRQTQILPTNKAQNKLCLTPLIRPLSRPLSTRLYLSPAY